MAQHLDEDSDEDFSQELFNELHALGIGDDIIGPQVFGIDFDDFGLYDEYDSDPFDYDYYSGYTDEDSYYTDDEDMNHIFVSLQDSGIIRKLVFTRQTDDFQSSYRLPIVMSKTQTESYENIIRLLDELLVLMKTWKKRVQHPFTAHIQREDVRKKKDSRLESIEYGRDYQSEDYDEDEFSFGLVSVIGCNEALTKKKFCNSTKLFYQIFDSDEHFDSLFRFIVKIKKYMYEIAFGLFLEALPNVTALPNELWEKIWKHTQTPFLNGHTQFSAGLRAKDPRDIDLENDRLRELFGAVGNLHILIFEMLFKHPFLIQTPTLVDVDLSGLSLPYSHHNEMFLYFHRMLRAKFTRFQELEALLRGPEDLNERNGSIVSKIENGTFFVEKFAEKQIVRPEFRDISAGYQQYKAGQFYCLGKRGAFFVTSSVENRFFAHVESRERSKGIPGHASDVTAVVTIMEGNRPVACIDTNIPIFNTLYSPNQEVFWRLFDIFDDRFAIIERDRSDNMLEVHQWVIKEGESDQPVLNETNRATVISIPSPEQLLEKKNGDEEHMKTLRTVKLKIVNFDGADHILVTCTMQEPGSNSLSLHLFMYQADTGNLVKSTVLENFAFEDAKTDTALMYSLDASNSLATTEVVLFDLKSFKESARLPLSKHITILKGMASDETHLSSERSFRFAAMFDAGRKSTELLVFTQCMSTFELIDYSDKTEPKQLLSGSHYVPELTERRLCYGEFTLRDGAVFFPSNRSVQTTDSLAFLDEPILCLDTFVLNLWKDERLPIMAFVPSNLEQVSLNEFSWHVQGNFAKAQGETFGQARRKVISFLEPNKIAVVVTEKEHLVIDFSLSPREVADLECDRMEQQRKEREEKERKKKEAFLAKKKREEEAAKRREREKQEMEEKFVGTGRKAEGYIKNWNKSYGFVRPNGEAGKLGSMFLHISDIMNRGHRYISSGNFIEFEIGPGRKEGEYRAKNINLIPRNKAKKTTENKT